MVKGGETAPDRDKRDTDTRQAVNRGRRPLGRDGSGHRPVARIRAWGQRTRARK